LEEEEQVIVDDRDGDWLFSQRALQKYVLLAAQDVNGGLKDKPDKGRDFYHTCYALSGLSIAQHSRDGVALPVINAATNTLHATDAVHNVRRDRVQQMKSYFANKKL